MGADDASPSELKLYFLKAAQLLLDLFVLSVAYWAAFALRFEFDINFKFFKLLMFTWPYVILLQYLVLNLMGIPRFVWRYVGIGEAWRTGIALLISTLILMTLRLTLVSVGGYSRFVVIPFGVLAIHFMLSFLGIAGMRFLRRFLSESEERSRRNAQVVKRVPTLLIGAGRAGISVAREVAQNPGLGFDIVGFIDDDHTKVGSVIQGHKVLGGTAKLNEHRIKTGAEQAVITITSAKGAAIRRIVNLCETVDLPVKIIPGIHEILGGNVSISRIREVTIADLLGRDVVELDTAAIDEFLQDKCVMVTGAGGSIGSEICRQVAVFRPSKLLFVEQSENALFSIHQEFRRERPDIDFVPLITDVTDASRVEAIFELFKPNVVFHAAAHKHVPMMEWNPGEALKNNVFGTKMVADAANKHGVDDFVMISTDKAVNPTSVMGASKRVAELYVQALSKTSKTKFVAVRFGNVLGSAGSVVPIFRRQIANGGPVTVTHPEMKRYFMTIPEASQLVMQAAAMGHGGEIFVLDMGEPMFILDLAKDLIRLSGFSTDEIDIEYSGLRPGEKLFEELATDSEEMAKTRHPKIFIGKIDSFPLDAVQAGLDNLGGKTNSSDLKSVREALAGIVPEMRDS